MSLQPHRFGMHSDEPKTVMLHRRGAGWAAMPDNTESSGQLSDYWERIRRKLGLIALLAIIGATIGCIAALLQAPIYRARTVLDIRNLNESMLNMRDGGGAVAVGGNPLPEAYLQTEIKILQSDSILKRARERLPKSPVAPMPEDSLKEWRAFLHLPSQMTMQDLMADASRRVKIRALGNTRIVEILCDARDGQLAANMCNNLAQTYIDYNVESRFQSTRETGQWLSSQLDNVRRRLEKAESDLRDSARESAMTPNSDTENPAQEKLKQLQAEMSRAQAERIARESQYEVVAASQPDALPLSLDAGPIREYRLRLNEFRRQLAEMSATMTPSHYRVKEIKSQIAETETALKKERDDLLTRLKTDFQGAERREAMLTSAYDIQSAVMVRQGDKAVRYNMLKREVDSGRKLYEALLEKVEEVGLAAAMRTSTISVVDKAVPPAAPYSPSMVFNTAIGFLMASCFGVALAIVGFKVDQPLNDPGEAPSEMKVRELGVIPSAGKLPSLSLSKRMLQIRANGRALQEPEFPLIDGPRAPTLKNPGALELATWAGTPIEVAEAFSSTMDSLLFADAHSSRAYVLTSPDRGDGKTTTATNLAIAFARINRRVVLVDGDMRKPRLSEIFGLDPQGGLSDILRSERPIDDLKFDEIARPTAIPNLFVVPTAAASDVAALLHSANLADLIRRLKAEFNVVVIDSPPMLNLSDARVLGWLADGVLMVLRAGKTTREDAINTQTCLREDGIELLGTVLNDWNPRRKSSYASYQAYLRNQS